MVPNTVFFFPPPKKKKLYLFNYDTAVLKKKKKNAVNIFTALKKGKNMFRFSQYFFVEKAGRILLHEVSHCHEKYRLLI